MSSLLVRPLVPVFPSMEGSAAPLPSPSARGLTEALADLGPVKPLPPPPRPTRSPRGQPLAPAAATAPFERAPGPTDVLPCGPALTGAASGTPSADEIVAALAAIAAPARPASASAAADLPDDFDPPPMIIGRALAERLSPPAEPLARPRPSPWPGLMVGFALSLVAGFALFLSLAPG
jgi:hypothetical protein